LASLGDVNPPADVRHLADDTRVSFIPMSDVTEAGRWEVRRTRRLGDVRAGYTPFTEDDVLFAKITPCMENGKGAHAVGLTNGVGFGSTEFHVLRARGGNSSRFLYHWLQSPAVRTRAATFMGGSAGQQRVQAEFFRHYAVNDLPPREQQAIAVVLDAADDVVTQSEAVAVKLRRMRAALLSDLLIRGVDERGKIRDRVQEEVPPSWTAHQLRDCLRGDPHNGLYKPASQIGSGVLLVGQTSITNDRALDWTQARRARATDAEVARYDLQHDDILLSRVYATLAGVGRPALVTQPPEPAVYESNMMRLRAESRVVMPRFLFELLRSPAIRRQIEGSAQLSNQASINRTSLGSIAVVVPSLPEQERVLGIFEEYDKAVVTEIAMQEALAATKAGLAADLLTGRVRLSESLIAELAPAG